MNEMLFGSGPQLWPTLPPGSDLQQPIGTAWSPLSPVSIASAAPLLAAGVSPQAVLAVVAIRRGQPMGPTTDQQIEDFVCDALDLLAGANDVELRCENGRATLTGVVSNKRLKRDAGEIVWAIPSVNDVQNNLTIAARRRTRGTGRETDTSGVAGLGRKQA